MAASDPHFRLRIPLDLRDMIASASRKNERSLNAEIVYRLRASFGGKLSEGEELDERVAQLKSARSAVQSRIQMARAEAEALDELLSAAIEARDVAFRRVQDSDEEPWPVDT